MKGQPRNNMQRHEKVYQLVKSIPCVCHFRPVESQVPCTTCMKVVFLLTKFVDNGYELPLNYDRKGVYSNE